MRRLRFLTSIWLVLVTACAQAPAGPQVDPRVVLTVPARNPSPTADPTTMPAGAAPTATRASMVEAAAASSPTPASGAGLPVLTEQEAVARVLPAVVRVGRTNESGTGVVVRSDGLVITNAHVVGDAKVVDVRLPDGRSLASSVDRRDVAADLAVVQSRLRGLRPRLWATQASCA